MEWINNFKEQPEESGEYIVRTKTQMGNSNTFNCQWHKKSKHWGCNNQIVTEWLKE